MADMAEDEGILAQPEEQKPVPPQPFDEKIMRLDVSKKMFCRILKRVTICKMNLISLESNKTLIMNY